MMAKPIPDEESLAPIFHVGSVIEDKGQGHGVVVGVYEYDSEMTMLWIFFPKKPSVIVVTDAKGVKQVRVDKTPRRINLMALALMKADRFQNDPEKFLTNEEL